MSKAHSSSLDYYLREHASKTEMSLAKWFGEERFVLRVTAIPGSSNRSLQEIQPTELSELSERVTFAIETKSPEPSTRSATFTVTEAIAILGGRWFDAENIDRVRRSINDRKAYPMPEYVPPPEKSLSAQGQTKKPGAHSESRHA